jgi:hypothetical protein
MHQVIAKILSQPWMVGLLTLSFVLSMMGYWARIRRDKKRRKNREQPNEQGIRDHRTTM